MSDSKKQKLELELIKLSQLDKDRTSTVSEIKNLQTELLNSRIQEVGFKEVLQENIEVFSTQANKNKLRKFLNNYPVVRIDLSYIQTSNYCLQVAFDKTQPFEPQYQQILPFLPYLVTIENVIDCPIKISGKHIKVKEHTYGDEGIIELVIPNNKHQIWACRTKNRVTSIIKKFDKAEDAFRFIYESYPFFK